MSVLIINNKEEFENQVLKANKPVLVDFWAPWCGPCKMVTPEVEAVAEAYDGRAIIAKVNVDEQPQIASEYNVMGIPTLIVIKEGHEMSRIVGFKPRTELSAALDKQL